MGYNSKYTGAQVESMLDAMPNKADKSTTLSGYGIADGVNAVLSSGSGNVLTALSINGHTLTYTKGITALTSHQTIYGLTIKGNGTALATYTPNSAALSIDITPSNIGAAAASHTHSYITATICNPSNNTGKWNDATVDGLKLKVWDVYTDGGPTDYGNILEINGISNHWKPQIWFDAGTGQMRVRNRNYNTTAFNDWRLVLDSSNYNSYAPTKTGTGASGTWGISVTGSSASCTGNAATASKLATARTITLTGSVTGSVSFDGSGNVSLATSTNHSHSQYLTAHQSIYALSVIAGSTTVSTYTPNSAANSITFVAGSNISLSADATNKKITIANTYSYSHPTGGANTTISAANGKVLSAITVNSLGHVTSVSSKTLVAADIPSLDWSKITSGKPTTLAGYGITDAYTKAQVDAAIQSAISTYITNALNTSV